MDLSNPEANDQASDPWFWSREDQTAKRFHSITLPIYRLRLIKQIHQVVLTLIMGLKFRFKDIQRR